MILEETHYNDRYIVTKWLFDLTCEIYFSPVTDPDLHKLNLSNKDIDGVINSLEKATDTKVDTSEKISLYEGTWRQIENSMANLIWLLHPDKKSSAGMREFNKAMIDLCKEMRYFISKKYLFQWVSLPEIGTLSNANYHWPIFQIYTYNDPWCQFYWSWIQSRYMKLCLKLLKHQINMACIIPLVTSLSPIQRIHIFYLQVTGFIAGSCRCSLLYMFHHCTEHVQQRTQSRASGLTPFSNQYLGSKLWIRFLHWEQT